MSVRFLFYFVFHSSGICSRSIVFFQFLIFILFLSFFIFELLFQSPHILSSGAKIWRKHFSKSAYFFIRRKGLAQTFFKVRTFFHQAQRFCANIFQSPHIFSSGAKVWRKHFSKSAYFFFRRKGPTQIISRSA